jgi:1,4-alpha-glucan branching enzyme
MSSAIRSPEDERLDALAAGTADDPFALLGRHETTLNGRPAVVIRTMQPAASAVEVITDRGAVPMTRRGATGVFEATLPLDGRSAHEVGYRFRVHDGDAVAEIQDPYQFGQVLSEFDLHLLSEGTHYRAWEKLGTHRVTLGVVSGVHFAVWAPNAQRVSVIGDFNRWDGRVHVMRRLSCAGWCRQASGRSSFPI